MNNAVDLSVISSKPDSAAFVDVCNLSFSYGDDLVLENVCLTVEGSGKIIGIFGPNGGGKTTFLKCLLGLLKPFSGSVRLFGLEPKNARKYVGYIPQVSKFDFDFPINVLQVVLMGRLSSTGLFKRYSKKDYEIAEDCLKKVGIWDLRDRQIGQLSGGQRQRAFIARALATKPKLLLMDEPNTGLDAFMQADLYKLLKELKKEMAIILVSHDMGAIFHHVDDLACLRRTIHFHDPKTLSRPDFLKEFGCSVDQAIISLTNHTEIQNSHVHAHSHSNAHVQSNSNAHVNFNSHSENSKNQNQECSCETICEEVCK